MVSQLLRNDKVSFVVAKPFTSNNKSYTVGEDFDQNEARDIEVFVRARFVIPVVDDFGDKPRHWYREIRLKSEVLERLGQENVQLVWPTPPDSMDMSTVSTGPVDEGQDELPLETDGAYDPGEHTVVAVREYLEAHPDDAERVLALEADGKARKGLLEEES